MMKTIYKSTILAAIVLPLSITASAQQTAAKDTTLNRQILLEKEFAPTLQDASKINTLPAVHEPVVKPVNLQYETSRPAINFTQYRIKDTGAGDIMTDIDFSKKRGYFNFGAGSHAQINTDFGYRILDTNTDELDVFARFNNLSGKINLENSDEKVKAKYSDLLINAKYQHNFELIAWRLLAGYENTGFNYYGSPFMRNPDNFNINKKQSLNNFSIGTGLKSTDSNEFIYDAAIKFNIFSTKYGPNIEDDGPKGNIIEGKFDVAAPFGADKVVGINMNIMNQSFSKVKFIENAGLDKDDYFHSLTKASLNPYISFKGDSYFLKLGVKTDYAIDNKNKLVVAPDLKLDWIFADKTKFYANVTGGINENTYLQIMRENRYVDMRSRVAYSRTPFDLKAGIASAVISGFELDIFGGYKKTKDEHFYVNGGHMIYGESIVYIIGQTGSWGNVSTPGYYDLSTSHIGGQIKTSLIPHTDLSAKVIKYFYDGHKIEYADYQGYAVGKEKIGNLPELTLDFNADIKPIEALTISANYHLTNGRKTLIGNEFKKMKNINEVNLRGSFQIVDWISLNAELNNVLNQKYETWVGYTHLGFNFMAGIGMKF
ncbi:hypothetical protein D0T53_00340 [Dysgonomonas sp. 216]|uniref:hypothetical protein n=1 Tax=Dysgonomonas sp. 216 TaxID=2302934 RepID=UPI0013D4296B|nr:hypothetical protein [Dysgonomonas sp. 216]NDW17362.1 hypothetical protein [Dysgonomonas sp. 216]